MKFPHLLLALLVVVVWGINFLFVKLGLEEIPPLLLCATRFALASIPAIFFVKRPSVSFSIVAAYGLVMFALQFAFVFIGMHVGMTVGMASLIMQVQVFFSLLFAAIFLREIPMPWQILGALISFVGIGIVAVHFDSNITVVGFLCILGAAASWGIGNLIIKKAQGINMITMVVWGSFIAAFPMIIASLIFDGPSMIAYTYHHVTYVGISALLYIVYASTWVGYGVWNWLLNRYPIGTVVPFTLLVPIVGILSSVIAFHEPFQLWKFMACVLVMGGLCINLLGTQLFKARTAKLKAETPL